MTRFLISLPLVLLPLLFGGNTLWHQSFVMSLFCLAAIPWIWTRNSRGQTTASGLYDLRAGSGPGGKTEDRRQRTEDRRQRTEGRGKESANRGRRVWGLVLGLFVLAPFVQAVPLPLDWIVGLGRRESEVGSRQPGAKIFRRTSTGVKFPGDP